MQPILTQTPPSEVDLLLVRVRQLQAEISDLNNTLRDVKHRLAESGKAPRGHVPIADFDYVQKVATEMTGVLERHGLMGEDRFYCARCKSRVCAMLIPEGKAGHYCIRCMKDVVEISTLDPVHLQNGVNDLHDRLRLSGVTMSDMGAKLAKVESALRRSDLLTQRLTKVLFDKVLPRLNKFKRGKGRIFAPATKSHVTTRSTRSIGL